MYKILVFSTLLLLSGCDQSSSINDENTHRVYLDQDTSSAQEEYHTNRLQAIQQGLKK